MREEEFRDELFELNHQINLLLLEEPGPAPAPAPDQPTYVFDLLETLNKDSLEKDIETIHLCCYYINTRGQCPFLQYFLYKPPGGAVFSLPSFSYSPKINTATKITDIMDAIAVSYRQNKNQYNYKGYKICNKKMYLFFDCSQMDIESVRLDKNNDLWLVLVDEIVNKGTICNYTISKETTEFFKNDKLLYLKNRGDNSIYENPAVVYAPRLPDLLHFCTIFGVSAADQGEFHFTDFEHINKEERTGLIRLGLFLGKEIPEYRYPLWIVKKFEQQIVLSSHILIGNEIK
jgi:hypothetical protein